MSDSGRSNDPVLSDEQVKEALKQYSPDRIMADLRSQGWCPPVETRGDSQEPQIPGHLDVMGTEDLREQMKLFAAWKGYVLDLVLKYEILASAYEQGAELIRALLLKALPGPISERKEMVLAHPDYVRVNSRAFHARQMAKANKARADRIRSDHGVISRQLSALIGRTPDPDNPVE